MQSANGWAASSRCDVAAPAAHGIDWVEVSPVLFALAAVRYEAPERTGLAPGV